MQAERFILETDWDGTLKTIPKLPPSKQLEVIVLVLVDIENYPLQRRSPHPNLAGTVRILGDIIDSIPVGDWDCLS